MSGLFIHISPIPVTNSSNLSADAEVAVPAAIRIVAGLQENEGPTDEVIFAAIAGFKDQFEYWFTRVIAGAVGKYRPLITRRVNVLVRPIELDGLGSNEVATRLVTDYVNRNFVTAGGWAIERMATVLAKATGGVKASSRGIDLERTDSQGNRHLYVIKSGTVTRNSDILSKLKQHARDAEKLIRQGGSKVAVHANYVVAVGATSSTFEDGINRPSSGEFWGEITGLTQERALALVSEVALAAGKQVTRNTDVHIGALVALVELYIGIPSSPEEVDWKFLFETTMTTKDSWKKEDGRRHKAAWTSLLATGYVPVKTPSSKPMVQPTKANVLVKKGRMARKGKLE